MKKYDTYKDSKLRFNGKIPLEWDEAKIKHYFEIGRGRVISQLELKIDGNYPVFSSQTKNDGCMGYIDTYDFDEHQLTWTTDGANAGEVFERIGRYNCTNVCGTLKPKTNLSIRFFLYQLQYLTKFYKRPDTNGAKIMNNEMAEIHCLIPSLIEQRTIASFLDHKTTQIDTIIEKKEQLVEKLTLKRQAIINEAVTKGLNPDVPMKDSGIEWLGEIPEHWEVTKLKFLGDSITGITYSPDDIVDDCENAKLVLRSSNIQEGKLNLENNVFVNKKINSKYLIRKGDILICSRNGSRNLIGKNIKIGSRVEGETWGAFMTVYRSVYNDFIYYFFNSQIFKALSSLFLSSTINQLTIGVLNNFVIAIPLDSKEQEGIVIFLKNKTEEFDNTIEKIKKTIDKLKLYRQSLISEAVTGKIDLRDWKQKDNK